MILKIIFAVLLLSYPITTHAQNSAYQEEEVIDTVEKKEAPKYTCGIGDYAIRVSAFINYPPFAWAEQVPVPGSMRLNNQAKGLAWDILTKALNERGIAFDYIHYPSYQAAQKALQRGELDMLLTSYYDGSPYSEGQTLYPSYISNPFVILSLKGKMNGVQKIEDLKGKKVILRHEEGLWPLIAPTISDEINVELVSGARNAYRKIFNGEADYLITSKYSVEAESRRFKIWDDIDVSDVVRSPSLFFVMHRKSICTTEHGEFLEEKLKEIVSNQAELKKMLSEQIVYWGRRFRSEPALTKGGAALEDETSVEITQDLEEIKRIEELKSLNPETLIDAQMEKMEVEELSPLLY